MGEWLFAGRVKVIGGARMERWSLDMDVQPTSSGLEHITRRQTDVLPSLAVNVALSDVQNLRLSATQTLARPEYRELAPVQYYSLAGDRPEAGDSSLQRTLVQNYDLRWELYPSAGEVLSFAAFAKHFDQPIERIEIAATGANLISYANAASAMNYGVEMELRRGLGFLSDRLDPFTFFTNATVMRSRIQLGGNTRSAATNPDRPMVGQAPYVVNAGLSYAAGDQGSASATLLYNVVGKRIWAAAQVPLRADAYEMPRHSLDLSLRLPVLRGMDAKLDASNLLDSPVEVKQGDVVRLRYRTGRTVSAGFTWRP
jgi:outer membrane receptor protein involved in Fe transport